MVFANQEAWREQWNSLRSEMKVSNPYLARPMFEFRNYLFPFY